MLAPERGWVHKGDSHQPQEAAVLGDEREWMRGEEIRGNGRKSNKKKKKSSLKVFAFLPQCKLFRVRICLHVDAKRHRLAKSDRAGWHQNLHIVIQSQSFSFGRNRAHAHCHRTSFQHVLKTPIQEGAPLSGQAQSKASKRPNVRALTSPWLVNNGGTLLSRAFHWYDWVIHIHWWQSCLKGSFSHLQWCKPSWGNLQTDNADARWPHEAAACRGCSFTGVPDGQGSNTWEEGRMRWVELIPTPTYQVKQDLKTKQIHSVSQWLNGGWTALWINIMSLLHLEITASKSQRQIVTDVGFVFTTVLLHSQNHNVVVGHGNILFVWTWCM